MTIDKEALEKSRRDEEYRKLLEELRKQSEASTNESMQGQIRKLGEVRQRYHQASHDFKEAKEHRNRVHSTESTAAVIWGFRDSLKAMGGMKAGLEEIVARKLWMKIYPVLAPLSPDITQLPHHIPRTMQSINAAIDNCFGTDFERNFSEPLPPAVIPYLAEVDDRGVLRCNLLENEELNAEVDPTTGMNYRQEFIDRYEAPFRNAIIRGMREARDNDDQPIYDIDETNPDAPIISVHETGLLLTPEAFADFRETVLTQALTQEFGEIFRAEAPPQQRMP